VESVPEDNIHQVSMMFVNRMQLAVNVPRMNTEDLDTDLKFGGATEAVRLNMIEVVR
jgi:hypothetical protein